MKAHFSIQGKTWTFEEVTLRMYYEIKAHLAQGEDRKTEFDIVSSMTGCPPEDLKKLKYQDWMLVWSEAQHHLSALGRTTDVIRPIVEFDGVKYGLPAIEDITIGEFADLDLLLSDSSAENKLAEIAAVLYRPIVSQKGETLILESYDSVSYRDRVAKFADFPLTAIKSANAFFLQSANSSLKSTAEYLLKEAQKTNLMSPEDQVLLQSLLQQDPGGDLSTLLQEKILSGLTKLPTSQYVWPSTGLRGRKTKIRRWLDRWTSKQSS